MIHFDIEATRKTIREMDFVRGTPAQVARWRRDGKASRADTVVEGMTFDIDQSALSALMLEEAVPPEIAIRLTLTMLDNPVASAG